MTGWRYGQCVKSSYHLMTNEHANAQGAPQPPGETTPPKKGSRLVIVAIVLVLIAVLLALSKSDAPDNEPQTPPAATPPAAATPDAALPLTPEAAIDATVDDLLAEELEAPPEESDPALTGENNTAVDDLGQSLGESQF